VGGGGSGLGCETFQGVGAGEGVGVWLHYGRKQGGNVIAAIAIPSIIFGKGRTRLCKESVMIADIEAPDSNLARQAEQLARSVSSETLFNHVMRCYWFGELFAQQEGTKVDSEMMFLSSVLHDLGLTGHAPGPHRFEIEGATAARTFLLEKGASPDRAQQLWDNIALHTMDVNAFRGDTSRLMQLGLAYDVSGVPGAQLEDVDVSEVLRRYPRLHFQRSFNELLNQELDSKQPYHHWFHICTRIAHNRAPLTMEDAPTVLSWAPFEE
jgi:hypothetical protein